MGCFTHIKCHVCRVNTIDINICFVFWNQNPTIQICSHLTAPAPPPRRRRQPRAKIITERRPIRRVNSVVFKLFSRCADFDLRSFFNLVMQAWKLNGVPNNANYIFFYLNVTVTSYNLTTFLISNLTKTGTIIFRNCKCYCIEIISEKKNCRTTAGFETGN